MEDRGPALPPQTPGETAAGAKSGTQSGTLTPEGGTLTTAARQAVALLATVDGPAAVEARAVLLAALAESSARDKPR